MKLKIGIIALAINIIILLLDFIFAKTMPKSVMYVSLVYVMISTPILLYLAMRGARDQIK